MKFENINLPNEITSVFGLKPINMKKLGDIVLIAGRNGAGKSRFLQVLREQFSKYPNEQQIAQSQFAIDTSFKAINSTERTIENLKLQIGVGSPDDFIKDINNGVTALEAQLAANKRSFKTHSGILDAIPYFKIIPEKIENALIDLVPKSLALTDSNQISPNESDKYANAMSVKAGVHSSSSGSIPLIAMIMKRWISVNTSKNDDITITSDEIFKINADYERLRKHIKLFLGADLMRDIDGSPSLFGKKIGEAKLSDGQKILLQFCLTLFAQEASLENLIIFMDEPENHLHPAALMEVIDKISSHVKNGQLWIATHSVNILAHFDPSYIWYVEDGEVSYAGNIPNKVLEGLLGNEEEIEKLSNFLSLPAQMAINKFAFESLFNPEVLLTSNIDPQVAQINKIIAEKLLTGDKIKILDYGIGKGRLLSTIFENERLNGNNISASVDFYGFDIDDTHKDMCQKVFENVYGAVDNRYFSELKNILAIHDENTFDFVIMCNVFHEIDPKDWLSLFNSSTAFTRLLKDDGFLLIVEDQFLAVGEKAHSKGFLVFDSLEFKKLFKITSADNFHTNDYRGDGRLKAHYIPKNVLQRIDSGSRIDAINALNDDSKTQIKKLRGMPPSFKNGKLHGFWAQQLANSLLSLEELRG